MSNNDLPDIIRLAQESSLYGFDTTMIDTVKRTPEENLRAFVVQLTTKTFKSVAEQLAGAEKAIRKGMDGAPGNFAQGGGNYEKNIVLLAKNLQNLTNKIANNIYTIQKVQNFNTSQQNI